MNVLDDALVVRVEDATQEFDDEGLGCFERSESGALHVARELSAQLRRDFGSSDQDPLFISLFDA